MQMSTEMKQCTKCGKKFPATRKFFKEHKATKDGLDSWCRQCVNAASRAWRVANPDKTRASRKAWKAKHPLIVTWDGMIARCFNPHKIRYSSYGAKGVAVCEHWQGFKTFETDMSPKPEGTSLGRFGDVGDYSCFRCDGNAVWMTHAEQLVEAQKKKAA
jgi:hypothetical protein